MDKIIIGKIVSILTKYEVAINIGSLSGVEKGMIFGIKLLIPEIIDPDTAEVLYSGSYYEKGEIKIESVLEKISFGSLVPTTTYSLPGTGIEYPSYNYPPVSSSSLLVKESDWLIRTGDEVFFKKTEEKKVK